MRGTLVPHGLPLHRSRAELFDELVLDVVDQLDVRWSQVLSHVEFAVEDVPPVTHRSPDDVVHLPNVIEDSSVPLSRLIPGRIDGLDREHPPRIVIYRRPLEVRGKTQQDLASLVRDVVVEQVANLLGLEPSEVDPDGEL